MNATMFAVRSVTLVSLRSCGTLNTNRCNGLRPLSRISTALSFSGMLCVLAWLFLVGVVCVFNENWPLATRLKQLLGVQLRNFMLMSRVALRILNTHKTEIQHAISHCLVKMEGSYLLSQMPWRIAGQNTLMCLWSTTVTLVMLQIVHHLLIVEHWLLSGKTAG